MLRVGSVAAFVCAVWAAQVHFDPTDPRISYSGRVLAVPGNVSFVWPGITISTTFTGTTIGAVMKDRYGQYDVIIDGQKSFEPFVPRAATPTSVNIASQLRDGTHTFVLRRRTESFSNVYADNTASISSFFVDQGKNLTATRPLAKPRRKIEIIGDSITCGSGILGEDSTCKFSFDVQDYFSSYSALVAEEFNADINVICWSGKGLVRNYNTTPGSCEICPDAMPAYFPYALDVFNDNSSQWNFSTYVPDVLIINLGVNDFDPGNPPPVLSGDTFIRSYINWVTDIQTNYYNGKNVEIFLACREGKSLPGPCLFVQDVQTGVNSPHVHFANLTSKEDFEEGGLGCDGHPGVAAHRRMADLLIQKVGSVTKWVTPVVPTRLEASSVILLAAFFLVGIGGQIWGCVVRKPTKGKDNLLLEQKHER